MDKSTREIPANSASHANLSFGEVMSIGEQAAHSVAATIKKHPVFSAVVAVEAVAAVGLAVVTHGHTIKETEKLAALENDFLKTGTTDSRQALREARSQKIHTDLYKAALMGPGSVAAVAQFYAVGYLEDLAPVRFFTSDKQCLQNSSDKTDCITEEKAAIKLHEAKAMRFATNNQCQEKTGFICSIEGSSFRPQLSGFVSAKSEPHAGFPVYRDKNQEYFEMNGTGMGFSGGEFKLLNGNIATFDRSSVACLQRVNHRYNGYPKDHCQV